MGESVRSSTRARKSEASFQALTSRTVPPTDASSKLTATKRERRESPAELPRTTQRTLTAAAVLGLALAACDASGAFDTVRDSDGGNASTPDASGQTNAGAEDTSGEGGNGSGNASGNAGTPGSQTVTSLSSGGIKAAVLLAGRQGSKQPVDVHLEAVHRHIAAAVRGQGYDITDVHFEQMPNGYVVFAYQVHALVNGSSRTRCRLVDARGNVPPQ